MQYYKRWIGDYTRDTGHLSFAEHGCYTLMLDVHYATEKPLPSDRQALYRLLRAMTDEEKRIVNSIANEFWQETEAGLVNKKASAVMAEATETTDNIRRAAREREAAKRKARLCHDGGTDVSETEHGSTNSHSHSHSQKTQSENPKHIRSIQKQSTAHVQDFDLFKQVYPKRDGTQPWARAMKAATARIKEGCSFADMIEGAKRYAEHCAGRSIVGTQFVMQAATFLGPEQHFLGEWHDKPADKVLSQAERIAAKLDAEDRENEQRESDSGHRNNGLHGGARPF